MMAMVTQTALWWVQAWPDDGAAGPRPLGWALAGFPGPLALGQNEVGSFQIPGPNHHNPSLIFPFIYYLNTY